MYQCFPMYTDRKGFQIDLWRIVNCSFEMQKVIRIEYVSFWWVLSLYLFYFIEHSLYHVIVESGPGSHLTKNLVFIPKSGYYKFAKSRVRILPKIVKTSRNVEDGDASNCKR